MTNPIVNINVSARVAPTPSKLQKKGALISQGATNTAQGAVSLLTQLSDLTPLLNGSAALTSVAWSGALVTATAAAPHGLTVGDTYPMTIAGVAPAAYNGNVNALITGASTFTYPLAANPGSQTVAGVYTLEDVAELLAMATTFFAQGSGQAVSVLELSSGDATEGVGILTAWITANPGRFYSYLVPRYWDGNAAYLAMLGNFNALTAKTYFFTTTTLQNYGLYTNLMKCVQAEIEAPVYGIHAANVLTAISYTGGIVTGTTTTAHGVSKGQYFQIAGVTPAGYNGWFLALDGTTASTLKYALASDPGAESVLGTLVQSQYASAGVPATEFSLAAQFQVTLNYAPSSANRMTNLNQAFVTGVTAFPTQGNAALLETLNEASINFIGTGAAGGISATIVVGGKNMDGKPFRYWYAVDWAQINVAQNVNAALINGANDPSNPVDYNQNGINSLQQVAVSTMNTGISGGLVLNPTKALTLTAADYAQALNADTYSGFTLINADPFPSYVAENPNDYGNGVYDGFSIDMTPLRGFESITFNITVSDFAS